MLTFHETMDPRSREIRRDGRLLGYLLWHPERAPGVSFQDGLANYLTIAEMRQIVDEYLSLHRNP
jgi:hypothetical protein